MVNKKLSRRAHLKMCFIQNILILLFLYQSQSYGQTKSIEVSLSKTERQTDSMKFSDYMYTQADISEFKIPLNLGSTYVVKEYILDDVQHLYNKLTVGKLSRSAFDSIIGIKKLDTTIFSFARINSTFRILVLKRNNNTFDLIPDINFNKDFSDDSILHHGKPDAISEVKLNLLEYIKGKLVNTSYRIDVGVGSDEILINWKPDAVPLFITHFNSFSGSFFYKDKKFKVEFIPQFLNSNTKLGNLYFLITVESDIPSNRQTEIKDVREPFEADGIKFKVKSIDRESLRAVITVL